MRKGGFRKKMNLDLTPEEFSILSLREANEILDRLAKRYNQRVKDLYKRNPYVALKVYEYNKVEVGKPVFSRRKAKTVNEARERFAIMQKFSGSRYASITAYRKFESKAMHRLAENLQLEMLSSSDKEELAGFFDYVYDKLKMNQSEYNYKELAEFFSVYKLTVDEKKDRTTNIQDLWRDFKSTSEPLSVWTAKQKLALKESGAIAKGDNRTFSQIIRDAYKNQ
nr:MAG TPA: hypothetical protein [Caudoviricetes sp.]